MFWVFILPLSHTASPSFRPIQHSPTPPHSHEHNPTSPHFSFKCLLFWAMCLPLFQMNCSISVKRRSPVFLLITKRPSRGCRRKKSCTCTTSSRQLQRVGEFGSSQSLSAVDYGGADYIRVTLHHIHLSSRLQKGEWRWTEDSPVNRAWCGLFHYM